MEYGELDSIDSEQPNKLAFKSQWDNLCAYYMSIGVSPQEYWHGDYSNLKYYVEAHRHKMREKNYMSYIDGLYTFHAISTALSNFHLDGKTHEANQYLDRPFDLFSIPLTKEEKQQFEREKAIRFFEGMMKTVERK